MSLHNDAAVFVRRFAGPRSMLLSVSSLLLPSLILLSVFSARSFAQTELGSEDDLTVLGTDGTAVDPDTEIKGFTVFGSTQAAYAGALVGPGNVVVNGVLAVSTGAYFVGNSTFTGAGKIFIGDGSAGQVLSKNSGGYLQWTNTSALGDNLGDHTAIQDINAAGWDLVNVSSVAFTGLVGISSATKANYGGIYVSTHIYTPGNVYADKLYGDGSGLSGVSGSPVGESLTSANIWVGNVSDLAAAVAMSGNGSLSNTGAFTLDTSDAYTWTGPNIFQGAMTIGDGGDAISVNSSAWDISTAGAVSGVTTLGMSGVLTNTNATTSALTMSGATSGINFTGTAVINTSDWDISATGGMTGITDITNTGFYTQSGTSANTFTGATTISNSLTVSSLTATNALGIEADRLYFNPNVALSSTTAANYGGVYASTHVYVNGDVHATKFYGDGSGLTGIGSPVGEALASANIWVGNVSDLAAAVTMSGNGSLSNTGAFTLDTADAYTWTGTNIFQGAMTMGDGGDAISVNSSAWDISTAGAVSGVTTLGMSGVLTNTNATTSALTMSGATSGINFTGTAVINTSDWDISATGGMTGITDITNTGFYTQSGTSANTFTGATTISNSLTVSSLTATNALGIEADRLYFNPNVALSSTTAANYGGVYASTHVYVNGDVHATKFYGDISGASGLPSGDNLGSHVATTTLNMAGFPIINVSTINMQSGSIAIVPQGTAGSNNGYGISIGSNAYNNYTAGLGIGYAAYNNHDYGTGLGNLSYSNYSYGVGVGVNTYLNYGGGVGIGSGAHDNYTHGLGVGEEASGNYNSGIGVGYQALNNKDYGIGIGSQASGNQNYGIGIGAVAAGNYNNGIGIGNQADDNYEYGVGIGYGATGNYYSGVGIGDWTTNNHDSGTGVGAGAGYNYDYGVGIGAGARNNSHYAVGVGAESRYNKGYGSALGAYSYASSSSTALGSYAKANAELSLALGYGTVNNSTGTASFGVYALYTSSNIVAVGSITANAFYGDGSGLTGIDAGAGPSIDVSTINATATTPYGGVNITTNTFIQGGVTIGAAAAPMGANLIVADNGTGKPGLLLYNTGTKPTCSSLYRGGMFYERSASGIADKMYICMKMSTDAYQWVLMSLGN
ncbi:MAG: beta strand repeat-containing protein [Elusimicrobiales bacterium]